MEACLCLRKPCKYSENFCLMGKVSSVVLLFGIRFTDKRNLTLNHLQGLRVTLLVDFSPASAETQTPLLGAPRPASPVPLLAQALARGLLCPQHLALSILEVVNHAFLPEVCVQPPPPEGKSHRYSLCLAKFYSSFPFPGCVSWCLPRLLGEAVPGLRSPRRDLSPSSPSAAGCSVGVYPLLLLAVSAPGLKSGWLQRSETSWEGVWGWRSQVPEASPGKPYC